MLIMTPGIKEKIAKMRMSGATEQEIKEYKRAEAERQMALVDPLDGPNWIENGETVYQYFAAPARH